MKILLLLALLLGGGGTAIAQEAPERSTPYTAVRWDGDKFFGFIGGVWYQLLTIDGVPVSDMATASKEKYRKYWRKRLSLDLTEILRDMGHPLPATVKLSVRDGEKSLELTEVMTTKNKNAVWKYMKEHPVADDLSAEKSRTSTSASTKSTGKTTDLDKLQKDIAKAVNLTMEKPFAVKSGKIEYKIEGHKMFAGTETFYFDDFGKTVVVVTDIPGVMGMSDRKTTIWKDKKTTVIDHDKKTHYTTPIRPKSTEPPVISYSNATQRKQGGYETQAPAAICGKDCEVFKHSKMNVTYWLWKGLSLKEINYSVGGDIGYTREAKSVEELAAIPATVMAVPAGYVKK